MRGRATTTARRRQSSPATTTSASAVTTTVSRQGQVDDCAADVAWWCPYIQPTDCYEASATCCLTCRKYRKPVPGCEYGDRYWWCSTGNFCYNDFLRKACCIACQTNTDATTCRDDSTACSTVEAADCYNNNTRTNCCQTCAKFNTGTKGCEFGDRQTWCFDVARPECSFYQDECCATCS